jgi:hypothetical protein
MLSLVGSANKLVAPIVSPGPTKPTHELGVPSQPHRDPTASCFLKRPVTHGACVEWGERIVHPRAHIGRCIMRPWDQVVAADI